MNTKINILSTKILLPSQKQLFLDANFSLIEDDFITITYLFPVLKELGEAIIITSQNAVQSLLQHPKLSDLKKHSVFCVGIKTKELLTKNGFNVVAYTDYATDLAEIISLIYKNLSFTFFSGNQRRDVLPNVLRENKIAFNEIEVYQTQLTSKKITDKLDGILFFSPSAVESYLEKNKIKNEICFCIGETTATTLENKKSQHIIIAEKPTIENVIDEAIEYYKQ